MYVVNLLIQCQINNLTNIVCLEEEATCRNFRHLGQGGGRMVYCEIIY